MPTEKPTREQAQETVETLLRWAGDDPAREGLKGTPGRVVKAFEEYFPAATGKIPKTSSRAPSRRVNGYDEMVVLRDIEFESHCEHPPSPPSSAMSISPTCRGKKVVGISKLARLVDVFSKRLQIQEKMTAQIATTLNDVLKPKGVAVVVEAQHFCMTTRGVHKHGTSMQTTHMLGLFRSDPRTRQEFLSLISMSPTRKMT